MKLAMISVGLAMGALPGMARADTFVFSDHDYSDANWTIPDSLFMDPAQTGQRLSGGNPGAYRQLGLIFAERPDYAADLNLTFTYTPASQGPITGVTYNFDLKVISAIGSTYYPLISQGGNAILRPVCTSLQFRKYLDQLQPTAGPESIPPAPRRPYEPGLHQWVYDHLWLLGDNWRRRIL